MYWTHPRHLHYSSPSPLLVVQMRSSKHPLKRRSRTCARLDWRLSPRREQSRVNAPATSRGSAPRRASARRSLLQALDELRGAQREDVLFLSPPGTGKSYLAQAIGRAAIQQGHRVIYREAHTLLEELADATLAGARKDYVMELATVPLFIIDDLGMRKLAHTAAEDLLERSCAAMNGRQHS